MKSLNHRMTKIVIVGGGTAGWLAAATLGNIFKGTAVSVELIESPEVGIIGVGEATLPHFLRTIGQLGIDEVDFIRQTQSTFKLGIKFADWAQKGRSYFHSFGKVGRPIDGHDFYQIWLKAHAEGDSPSLMEHSPESILAEQNRFFLPHKAAHTPLAAVGYALHLDSALVGQYLSRFAQQAGVRRRQGHVESVEQRADGSIASLRLKDAGVVSGDFFIDCTGFKGLLIEQTLHAGYEDWSDYLPCDRAVTLPSAKAAQTLPYTLATAREAGWTWRIPLQHRTGNGYVYCSDYVSDDEAAATLLNGLDTPALAEPRLIPFKTGIRRHIWYKNCLALGLAQGFLEPLESTAIHLVSRTLALFVQHFPDRVARPELVAEFNRRMREDYSEIRDFLVMHYCTTARDDTPFWRRCQDLPQSQDLQRKLAVFKASGVVVPGTEVLFEAVNWQMVLTGMNFIPERYNPTVDALDYEALRRSLAAGKKALAQIVSLQPGHDEFIERYCRAPEVSLPAG